MTTTGPRTVLFVSHNHPGSRPGGAEGYALELYRAFQDVDGYRPLLLAKGGPPMGRSGRLHEGTVVAPVGSDPDEYHYFTDGYTFDWLTGSITDKDFYTQHLHRVLEALRPDVVHFQHTLFLGYDAIRQVRATLPDAVIVLTLHEFAAICHRDGQMVRTGDAQELCDSASPRRCHECFPHIPAGDFYLRRRLIQSHLAGVDLFVTPSDFLRRRFVDWGLPAERVVCEENGRLDPPRPATTEPRAHRDRFAFFGQITAFKGVDLLLEAMASFAPPAGDGVRDQLLALVAGDDRMPSTDRAVEGARPTLVVHGANLDLQPAPFRQRLDRLLEQSRGRATMAGPYLPPDLPSLMSEVDWVVVPSIWWENSPLVIQEAFAHGRPIICADIGGMAEKVTDGVDGLHFRARDPRSLAATIERAATTPGLWDRLRDGIRPPHRMVDHVGRLRGWYDQLLDDARPDPGDAPIAADPAADPAGRIDVQVLRPRRRDPVMEVG